MAWTEEVRPIGGLFSGEKASKVSAPTRNHI